MSPSSNKSDFRQALVDACMLSFERLGNVVGEERVYAFALYTTSGFEGFSCAAATEESFARIEKRPGGLKPETLDVLRKDHPDLYAKVDLENDSSDYYKVTADEWEYVGDDGGAFERVNQLADQIHEATEGREWSEIKPIFLEQIDSALQHIREGQPFKTPPFTSDVLLTLQYSDMNAHEPDLLAIAEALNTSEWCTILRREWGRK